MLERNIPSNPDICAKLMQSLVDALEDFGWAEREIFGIRMAMEEAIINAIRHGNRCSTDKMVLVQMSVNGDDFIGTVTDEGDGFDPEKVPDPTDEENLERCSGRGLALIDNFADEMQYNATGNSLTIRKRK